MCTPRWYINYAQKFKMQLMVTSVDDNIKYLKNCGAKHHIEMSTEIMYYTQGLQFRRGEDGYLQWWITRIKDQPLKWRGILHDELPSDTSILHHAFISIFIALWAVISRYVTILMAILSYFTRFTWRGRMPPAGILGWKRSKYWRTILRNSKSPETPRNTLKK